MPSLTQITKWFGDSNMASVPIEDGYWQIPRKHFHAEYVLHAHIYAGWLNLGAELFEYAPEVDHALRSEFYKCILELNTTLNGAYIGEEGGKLVLIRNDFLSDLTKKTVDRAIQIFDETHQFVYPRLLREAKRLGIRLVQPN